MYMKSTPQPTTMPQKQQRSIFWSRVMLSQIGILVNFFIDFLFRWQKYINFAENKVSTQNKNKESTIW